MALSFALGLPGCDSAVGSSSTADEGSSTSGANGDEGSPPNPSAPGSGGGDSSAMVTTAPLPPPTTATSETTESTTSATSGDTGWDGSSDGGSDATCGNGLVDIAEQCDGADLFGFTCEGLGLGPGDLACSEACLFDTAGCIDVLPGCGDGLIQPGEQCDSDDLQGFDCEALGLGLGPLSCTGQCVFDTSACTAGDICGNGVVEPGEQCDGADLQGLTCETLGLDGGELTCNPVQCTFDTSGCFG